jgi:hypothetical protein
VDLAAALERVGVVARVGQEVFESGQQERAKAPTCRIGTGMEGAVDETDEKRLGQILGFVGVCALPADECNNRGTISTAKALHRLPRAGVVFAGFEDKTPTRRLELTQSTPPRGWVPENGATKSLHGTDKARMPSAGEKIVAKKSAPHPRGVS